MHGYEMLHGWGGMWLGPLFMIGLPLLVVFLIVWFAMGGSWRGGRAERRSDPRTILDERFARGEIDDEEYRRRRDAIES